MNVPVEQLGTPVYRSLLIIIIMLGLYVVAHRQLSRVWSTSNDVQRGVEYLRRLLRVKNITRYSCSLQTGSLGNLRAIELQKSPKENITGCIFVEGLRLPTTYKPSIRGLSRCTHSSDLS